MNTPRCLPLVAFAAASLALGCIQVPPGDYAPQPQPMSGGEGAAPGSYLYLPASNISAAAVQSVVVQTSAGQQFTLGAGDIHAALGGRLAVPLPQGVSDGTAVINVNGQVLSIPFHVVVSMQPAPVLGSAQVASGDPRCGAIAGTWQGSIWSSANSVATATFQVFGDCRTVQGTISAASPGSGSVDATIEGVWDAASGTLVARDTQLFNVRPVNGTNFCETTRYEMHMTPDGELTGTNDTSSTSCGHVSPVRLHRVQ